MKRTMLLGLMALAITAASAQWAQVTLSVAHLRSQPGDAQEMCSQEYLGMPVKVVGATERGWLEVETADGYKGWISPASVTSKTEDELKAWRHAPRYVVSALSEVRALSDPQAEGCRNYAFDLVPNDIVVATEAPQTIGMMQVMLPDGRKGWVPASALTDIETWAAQPFDADQIIDRAYAALGTPYLWGGISVKGLDCSGLAKYCYLANGIFLLRDARLQVDTGTALDISKPEEYQRADLLFFGNKSTGKITHVAMYDADLNYIHSSGQGDRVGVNSLDPDSEIFGVRLPIRACRIRGMEDTPGIVRASNHPWLFDK